MSSTSRYRSKGLAASVIGISISYQPEVLLARGLGLDHLKELLVRLSRPILRHGANLAYGGYWKEAEDNFTYDLLRIVKAEQEDNSVGESDAGSEIGKLYCHVAWPHYVSITPQIEAQWVNSCRIVRFTQEDAGISKSELADQGQWEAHDIRAIFNEAVTLSAMRRLMMQGKAIDIPDIPSPERIPPIVARILLSGKETGYSGFVPGIFEEALTTIEHNKPVYLLGGYGGAAQVLADAMLDKGNERPKELTTAWQLQNNPQLAQLRRISRRFTPPKEHQSTEQLLDSLFQVVVKARTDLAGTLQTGLSDAETRTLMQTRDVATAVRLVRQGLENTQNLPSLPR